MRYQFGEEIMLKTRRGGLHPSQSLCGSQQLRSDLAEEGFGIHDRLHGMRDVVAIHDMQLR
jgi:hypothetical protein